MATEVKTTTPHSRSRPVPIQHPQRLTELILSTNMADRFLVTCPYCGEQVEIYVEPDLSGSFVQDCEVCCNPWRVRVLGRGDDRTVDVSREDGSE
jgi:Cysteine-rich CPXCG